MYEWMKASHVFANWISWACAPRTRQNSSLRMFVFLKSKTSKYFLIVAVYIYIYIYVCVCVLIVFLFFPAQYLVEFWCLRSCFLWTFNCHTSLITSKIYLYILNWDILSVKKAKAFSTKCSRSELYKYIYIIPVALPPCPTVLLQDVESDQSFYRLSDAYLFPYLSSYFA